MRYRVVVRFEVLVSADNPEEAKREALEAICLNPFEVKSEINVEELG